MDDTEVQHLRHRTRLVLEVTREIDVLTSLTPTPNHLLRFYFVGCAKEVSNLINHPVVSLFGSRMIGFVYYESLNREVQTKPIHEFRCDESLKTKVVESTCLVSTLLCPVVDKVRSEDKTYTGVNFFLFIMNR